MAATRRLGALLGLAVISGAIFFHLFTPLGINRVVDAAGNTDGGVLFYMACGLDAPFLRSKKKDLAAPTIK